MHAYVHEWLSLLLRWTHVIVGIAWIGASFYFIWLDNHLESSADPRLAGDLWAVHGGGFYHAEKFRGAPPQMPARLHWFKWEAYWTWMSGFALLVVLYYMNAEVYLIDPAVRALSPSGAVGIGLGTLFGGLAVYEGLCRSPLGRNDHALAVVMAVLLIAAAWSLTQVFSGRGAFIHFGALLATIMAGNVANVIIPGQRALVRAVTEGRAPDPAYAARAKQRSVHNTYFTLPVVFTMISGHYAGVYGHPQAWVALVLIAAAGALIRTWFVQRHKQQARAPVLIAGIVSLACAAALVAPSRAPSSSNAPAVKFSDVRAVIVQRCTSCHADKPTQPGFTAAPKGVMFDSAELIGRHAVQLHQQAVVTRVMPPGNLTGITDDERRLLDAWYRTGAKVE